MFSQGLKMFGPIRYVISSFSTADASVFCIPSMCDPNGNIHLLPGIPLHRHFCPNLKKFEENLLPYAIAGFCGNMFQTKLVVLPDLIVPVYIHLVHLDCVSLEILGSHSGGYGDNCLLGCCAVQSGRSLPTFQRSLPPPS
jgi:hypothetical protein